MEPLLHKAFQPLQLIRSAYQVCTKEESKGGQWELKTESHTSKERRMGNRLMKMLEYNGIITERHSEKKNRRFTNCPRCDPNALGEQVCSQCILSSEAFGRDQEGKQK